MFYKLMVNLLTVYLRELQLISSFISKMSPCSTLNLLTSILQYKSILIGFQFKRFYIGFRNVISIANKVLFFMVDFKIRSCLCGFVVSFLLVAVFCHTSMMTNTTPMLEMRRKKIHNNLFSF